MKHPEQDPILPHQPQPTPLTEAIRAQLIRDAQEAYTYAGIQGLCAEGRWECALSAMRTAKLDVPDSGEQ